MKQKYLHSFEGRNKDSHTLVALQQFLDMWLSRASYSSYISQRCIGGQAGLNVIKTRVTYHDV